MQPTALTFLLVCPFLFLAGFVDAIGGGGGLISLPIYLIAGLPPHNAIATNKMSSTFGTALATGRFLKHGLIELRLAIPSVMAAIVGSGMGAHLSLMVDTAVMNYILYIVLPVSAFFVLNKHLFNDERGSDQILLDRRTVLTAVLSAFLIGVYDGFYGPGTGTFLIIAFTVFAHLGVGIANAQAKIINLTTNLTSLVIFLLNGQVLVPLGMAAAACNMLGNYIGSGLVLTRGSKIVRPIILGVLALLLLKVLGIL